MKSKEYKKGFEEGYEKALDDHHILHGDAAEKFLANMKKTEEESYERTTEDIE